jgi:hypothetical protein
MSSKVSQVTKTSTKTTAKTSAVKPVAKVDKVDKVKEAVKNVQNVTKVVSVIRLSEEDKRNDPENYIWNPVTEKHNKRSTPQGKTLILAEKTGAPIPKNKTETERIKLVVETLKTELNHTDSEIKTALKSIISELPRGFPVVWGGKQKVVRSADQPKPASNSYIFFIKAVRDDVASANPTLSNTEIVSLMAKMWNATKDEDRIEYELAAANDKKRYEEEMKVFEANNPKLARAKSLPTKPTKVSAYNKYCELNRETIKTDNPDIDGAGVNKILSDNWNETKKDKDELNKYQELADEANADFEERITNYHKSTGFKNLSATEQKKAMDKEKYEFNPGTGRHVEKAEKAEKKTEKKPVKKTKAVNEKVSQDEILEETEAEEDVEAVEEEDTVEEEEVAKPVETEEAEEEAVEDKPVEEAEAEEEEAEEDKPVEEAEAEAETEAEAEEAEETESVENVEKVENVENDDELLVE